MQLASSLLNRQVTAVSVKSTMHRYVENEEANFDEPRNRLQQLAGHGFPS